MQAFFSFFKHIAKKRKYIYNKDILTGGMPMSNSYSVKLSTVVAEHADLRVIHAAGNYEEKLIQTADLNRPGLQLIGYFDYFDPSRIQVFGKSEITFLKEKSSLSRLSCFGELMGRGCPAVVIAHDEEILPECLEMAEKYDVTVLATEVDTSEFYAQLIGTLRRHLAPRETVHGVLVEVHGEGMLITGDSGVGKSETALELIKRGHRLIADDAVEILRTSRSTLEGRAPEIIRNFMELRGVGVVDIQNLYGIGAVKPETRIDMVAALELWDEKKHYDRLGIDTHTTEFLGVEVPIVTIPVRPGRNLAVILELSAMNNRQKKAGYNAAAALAARIDENADNYIKFSGATL